MTPDTLPAADLALLDAYSRAIVDALERTRATAIVSGAQSLCLAVPGDRIVGVDDAEVGAVDQLHRAPARDRIDCPTRLALLRGIGRHQVEVVPQAH